MQPINNCFDSADYETCVAAGSSGHDRFSSWALNVNAYADVDANPYVVGSQAYNIAHGLPAGPSWIERTTAAAEARNAAALAAATGTAQGAVGGQSKSVVPGADTSLSLAPLVLIGILALVVLRR